MSEASRKKLIQDWEEHCSMIRKLGTIPADDAKKKLKRIKRAKKDYRFFFEYYFPHYAKVSCAWFHIRVANKLMRFPKFQALLPWFRGAAKTVHCGVGYPLWLKINKELNVMLLVSDNSTKACKMLGDLQAELQYNPRFIHDYGEQYSHGDWAEGSFVTSDDKAFFAIGIGQSPRGIKHRENRPDYILIDDVDTKKRCKNESLTKEGAEWVTEDLMECFDSGEDSRERFVGANNIIHKKSIMARLIQMLPNAWVLKVNILGKDGTPSWPEKHTPESLQKKQANTTYRAFQREGMNNPIEDGKIFKQAWIHWKKPLPLDKYELIIGYGDLSYRDKGDYKAMPIMARLGKEIMVLKAFDRQAPLAHVAEWLYDYDEGLAQNVSVRYMIEGNFIQDDFIDDFDEEGDNRGHYISIIPDKRSKPDKALRIENMAGRFLRGHWYFNINEKDNNDMQTLVDQLLAFEKGSGAPDDGPDAMEGGVYYLNKFAAAGAYEPIFGERQHDNIY